jgi:hypothetical protein
MWRSGLADEEPEAPGGEPTVDDLIQAIREIRVGQFLLSTVSTLASLAYGKLESGDLGQAKAAIDAIQALLPVMADQVDEPILRDFEAALTNLKVAYADAVSRAE